ncbi:MAG TPA: LysM domain-containing protein [Thermoleophilaceae bacterium]
MVGVAVLVVVSGSSSGGDGDTSSKGSSASAGRTERTDTTPRHIRASYTVKTGDTLGAIAEQTGVSVEQLQELNPELDPQALVSGQRIKLRE